MAIGVVIFLLTCALLLLRKFLRFRWSTNINILRWWSQRHTGTTVSLPLPVQEELLEEWAVNGKKSVAKTECVEGNVHYLLLGLKR